MPALPRSTRSFTSIDHAFLRPWGNCCGADAGRPVAGRFSRRRRRGSSQEFLGRSVSFHASFFGIEEMKASAEEAGFRIEEILRRPPYDFEYPSQRAYVLARKPDHVQPPQSRSLVGTEVLLVMTTSRQVVRSKSLQQLRAETLHSQVRRRENRLTIASCTVLHIVFCDILRSKH